MPADVFHTLLVFVKDVLLYYKQDELEEGDDDYEEDETDQNA
jgi:hypothetical protein